MIKRITIFEMGGCCSTSLMNTDSYTELQRLDSYADFLKTKDIELIRVNVAMKPDLLAQIPNIDDYLDEKGIEVFPLTIIENKVVKDKSYPTQEELAVWTGIEFSNNQ
ncbi:arsenic metallochaperone ArsD family protein [Proteiniphilum sp.]|uniref:arsenic metallochaperone ArsD family protein n=1 Tax=Proteiniphilum sp. TaxID=1926877 RepID=UPI003319F8DE